MTLIADEVYAELAPVAEADMANGYPLRALNRAIGTMFAQVEEAVRARDGEPAWTQVFDADRAPAWLLPFSGQIAGVRVTATVEAEMRQQIKEEGGWKRGRLSSIVAAVQRTLGHANFCPNPSFEYDPALGLPTQWSIAEGFGTKAGAEYSVLDENPYAGRNRMQLHSKGGQAKEGAWIALPGTFYKGTIYCASFWALSSVGGKLGSRIGSLAGGNEHAGPSLTIPSNIWTRYSHLWTPTADVTDGRLAIYNPEATVETYAIDGVMVEAASTPSVYFDGDFPGCRWTGPVGASVSYNTLLGPKEVRFVERNGTPWQLLMITRIGETPSLALTRLAANNAKPGGVVLTLEVSDTPLIDEGTREIDAATTDTIDTATLADVT